MKDQWMKVGALIVVALTYGALFWLAVNPVLEYFGAKEVRFSQSLALVSLVIVSLLFVKEL